MNNAPQTHGPEKHGIVGGHVPERADWTIDQNWAAYTDDEHAVWRELCARQLALLPGRACDAWWKGFESLPIGPDMIPDFAQLNAVMTPRTGWRIVAVPGMVPEDVFFAHLAQRRFPVGQFIRTRDQMDYLQEPDVFHDLFGHVPMMMTPEMGDFMQAYGQGGLRARALGVLPLLSRLYWYTVEFGLVRQAEGLRLFGAGIVSSHAETLFALESESPHRIAFDLERVLRTDFRIDDFQEAYFVLPDLETLLDLAQRDFGPIYSKLRGLPEFMPGALHESDVLVHRGTGDWHHQFRAGVGQR